MANPSCSKTSLTTSCYRTPGSISEKQQKALIVYAKALQLAAIGGTNYLSILSTMLFSDAATMLCGFDEADRDAARVHLEFVKAAAAGASVPATINLKQAQINCLVEADDKQLDEADVMLTCKLGVSKAYPQ
jgi:hypothetical protein